MSTWASSPRAFCIALILSLVACSGEPIAVVPRAESTARSIRAVRPPSANASWMSTVARTSELIYASDMNRNEVFVLAYATGKLVGTLSGFSAVEDLCADLSGDVYVTDANRVVEYAHGGTSPIATFSYPNAQATSCAVDSHTGTLAVTNFNAPNIAIFSAGSATPTIVPIDYYQAISLTYDDRGTLFVDEIDPYVGNALQVLPPKQTKLQTLEDGENACLGSIEWYAGRLLMGIPDVSVMKIAHHHADIVGDIQLAGGTRRDAGGDQLVARDGSMLAAFGTSPHHPLAYKIGIWSYPSGRFVRAIDGFGAKALVGIAISSPGAPHD